MTLYSITTNHLVVPIIFNNLSINTFQKLHYSMSNVQSGQPVSELQMQMAKPHDNQLANYEYEQMFPLD